MKVCGIVCEYNPFHNGHVYHIQKAREISKCDILVCVMSGNFVQRGEMGICDKWKRAQTAIEHGCDLVVELPFPFVVQRADQFAYGALTILKQTKINALLFGSECNDLEYLKKLAEEPISYKAFQKIGDSYAKTLEHAFNKKLSSNDILGLFYIKELRNTDITPYSIKRTNEYHDKDIDLAISSASAIRMAIHNKQNIQHTTPMNMEDLDAFAWNAYYPYLQTFLLTSNKKYLSSLFLMDEGIESLFIKQAKLHMDWESFINACISKRYTRSSIQRTLTHALVQTTKKEIDTLTTPDYVRVLAYNTVGKAYLRTLQDEHVNIVSKFKDIPDAYRELELRSTIAYAYPYDLIKRESIIKRELLPAVFVK